MTSTPSRPLLRNGVLLLLAFAVTGAILVWWSLNPGRTATRARAVALTSPYANTRPDVAYVGDAACAKCHREIADAYRKHPMGRSLTAVSGAAADVVGPTQAAFDAAQYHYRVAERGGRVIHEESRSDERGEVLTELAHVVAYVLGSGTRGRSYLVEREGVLTQSPISWYSQLGRYDIAPGYDKANAHFERAVNTECLFCHANRVRPVEGAINRYESPTFLGQAIGCERCHGPGALHVRKPGKGPDGRDWTIVNPSALDHALRDAVCEQCHLQGDARIEPAGRALADFRPGLPLHRFESVFFEAKKLDKVRAVGQVEQMQASRCFQATKGALGCISCHDPHERPAAEAQTAYYRERCLTCHGGSSGCSLPLATRTERNPEDSCIACHMPRTPSADIVHNAATDHRIPRLAAKFVQPEAASASTEGAPLVHFHAALVKSDEEREEVSRALGIALAQNLARPGYAQAERERFARESLALLTKTLDASPDDWQVSRAKAFILDMAGQGEEAFNVLESALKRSPQNEGLLEDAASDAVRLRRPRPALAYSRRVVEVNPFSAEHQSLLAESRALSRDWDAAIVSARDALRLDPSHTLARKILIEAYVQTGQTARARQELHKLAILDPTEAKAAERLLGEIR
jgi:Flp pilus assembly protein TadD